MKNYDEMTVEEFLKIWNPDLGYDEYLKFFDEKYLNAIENGYEYTEHPVEHLLSILRVKKMMNDNYLESRKFFN